MKPKTANFRFGRTETNGCLCPKQT